MHLRRASDADIVRFAGVGQARAVHARFPTLLCEVAERNGAIVGIGGCGWDAEGRCWVFCSSTGFRAGKTLHRAALSFLVDLKTITTEIYAWRDDLTTSERWLKRLGFRYTGRSDGEEVWKWDGSLP